jgi:hypothetical protein
MSDIEIPGSNWDQLMALRQMSLMGILHEAQIQQLKYWPRVVFSHSTASEFIFNPEGKTIEFHLEAKGRAPKKMAERFKFFDRSVKYLLGEIYRVVVIINGKPIGDSPGDESMRKDIAVKDAIIQNFDNEVKANARRG